MLDVAIIGGGPAGSTAAALLAREGRRVAVFERDVFPRFHIGESLLPFSFGTLERIGVLGKMEEAGFLPKHGAWISSGCGSRDVKFYFKNGFRPRRDTAFQVTRAEFDHLLLQHAEECGAEIHCGAAVREVDVSEEGGVLTVESGEARTSRRIRARYVLDCGGRHTLLGAKFGGRRAYPGLRKIAVYAHYDGAALPDGPDGTLTRMIREPDGWFWVIPLSKTKVSVGWVTDLDRFRAAGQSPEEVLESKLSAQPGVGELLAGAEKITPVRTSGDYSYRHTRLFGKRWILAGDAAGFIDPVFSSGVFLALYSGEEAADALIEAMGNPARVDKAFRRYQGDIVRVMDLYHGFVSGWYTREFIETIMNPQEFFGVVPAVNSVLAGNPGRDFSLLWRLWVFRLLVGLQRFVPISPRLSLAPPVRAG